MVRLANLIPAKSGNLRFSLKCKRHYQLDNSAKKNDRCEIQVNASSQVTGGSIEDVSMGDNHYQHNLGRIGNYFRVETPVAAYNEKAQIASPMTKLVRQADALVARITGHKVVIHNPCNWSRLEIG